MTRYIGLDVHQQSCTAVVLNAAGKRLRTDVLETRAHVLRDFARAMGRPRHVCFEEGTQSEWLYELLEPLSDEVAVVKPSKRDGVKNDAYDRIGWPKGCVAARSNTWSSSPRGSSRLFAKRSEPTTSPTLRVSRRRQGAPLTSPPLKEISGSPRDEAPNEPVQISGTSQTKQPCTCASPAIGSPPPPPRADPSRNAAQHKLHPLHLRELLAHTGPLARRVGHVVIDRPPRSRPLHQPGLTPAQRDPPPMNARLRRAPRARANAQLPPPAVDHSPDMGIMAARLRLYVNNDIKDSWLHAG